MAIDYRPNITKIKKSNFEKRGKSKLENQNKDISDEILLNEEFKSNMPSYIIELIEDINFNIRTLKGNNEKYSDILDGLAINERMIAIKKEMDTLKETIKDCFYGDKNITLEEARKQDAEMIHRIENKGVNNNLFLELQKALKIIDRYVNAVSLNVNDLNYINFEVEDGKSEIIHSSKEELFEKINYDSQKGLEKELKKVNLNSKDNFTSYALIDLFNSVCAISVVERIKESSLISSSDNLSSNTEIDILLEDEINKLNDKYITLINTIKCSENNYTSFKQKLSERKELLFNLFAIIK